MIFRGLLMILMGVFLVGCASTRQPSDMSRLQINVAQLEKKLEEKDQEISELKDQVQDLSSQVDNMPSTNVGSSKTTTSSVTSTTTSTKDDDRIIRVSASAEEIQRALKNAGFYDGVIDGKMGSRSQKAVADFQKDHGLKNDGIVGKKTWIELKKYLAQ